MIGGLTYTDPAQFERVTAAVLIASPLASAAATIVFRRRVRRRARAGGPGRPADRVRTVRGTGNGGGTPPGAARTAWHDLPGLPGPGTTCQDLAPPGTTWPPHARPGCTGRNVRKDTSGSPKVSPGGPTDRPADRL
ncbi:hypothetical protein GCM10023085_49900 [Actinomadura viridis]